MAGSFDDLITFLLEEVALCGEQGTSLSEVFHYVTVFYEKLALTPSTREKSRKHGKAPESNIGSAANKRKYGNIENAQPASLTITQTIDRPFKETVWRWLTSHPDVWVGKEKQGNKLSLSQMEAKVAEQEAIESARSSNQAAGSQSQGPANPSKESATATLQLEVQEAQSKQLQNVANPKDVPLRIYISQERMWYALAGHGVDWTRLPRSEFILLSIIGAHRQHGIVQPELTQISGQDKRSLPRRTDALHNKGYIVKKPALAKGQRTSHCTLRRYADQNLEVANTISTAKMKRPADATTEELLRQCGFTGNVTDPSAPVLNPVIFVKSIMGFVKEASIITHVDLQRKMGVLGLRWHMRVLATTVRKLEIMGCLRRVMAKSVHSRSSEATHRSIKFIRDPKDHEWNLQWHQSNALVVGARNESSALEDEDDDADAEAEAYDSGLSKNPSSTAQEGVGAAEGQKLEVSGRKKPRWTTNRLMTHQLFDIVEAAGTQGISTMALKAVSVGTRFQRPIEHQLQRLTDCWQVSQPLHLRHLAIVRDTAQTKKYAHYNHLTYNNFQKKVDTGEASWECVDTMPKDKQKFKGWHPIGAEPELDEFGFPPIPTSRFASQDGDATLLESVLAANVEPHHLTTHDPYAWVNEDGSYGLDLPPGKGQSRKAKSIPNDPRGQKARVMRKERDPEKPLGRPRKYPKEEDGPTKRRGKAKYDAKRKAAKPSKTKPNVLSARKTKTAAIDSAKPVPNTTEQQTTPQAAHGTKRTADEASLDDDTVFGETKIEPPKKSGRPAKKARKLLDNELGAATSKSALKPAKENIPVLTVPGVYINPPGSAKPRKQGRPRKTMIAVFRSDRLKDVDWTTKPLVIPSRSKSMLIDDGDQNASKRSAEAAAEPLEGASIDQPTGESILIHVDQGSVTGNLQTVVQADSPIVGCSPPTINDDVMETTIKDLRNIEEPSDDIEMPLLDPLPGILDEDQVDRQATPYPTPHTEITDSSEPQDQQLATVVHTSQSDELRASIGEPPSVLEDQVVECDSEGTGAPAMPNPAPKSPLMKKKSGLYPGRGSLGLKRRQIILDIVKKCGGVFPGDKELWYPYTTAWMKDYDSSRPDPRTVAEAKKSLLDSGKLRRIVFCFRNSKGLMIKKHIVTLPEIAADSEAVLVMQQNMIMEEPNYYLPPEIDISDEMRKELSTQKHTLPTVPVGIETEQLVEINHKLASATVLEKRRLREEKRLAKEKLTQEKAQKREEKESLRRLAMEHKNKHCKPSQGHSSRIQAVIPRKVGSSKRPRGFSESDEGEDTSLDTDASRRGPGRPRKWARGENDLQHFERVTTPLDMLIGREKSNQRSYAALYNSRRLSTLQASAQTLAPSTDRTPGTLLPAASHSTASTTPDLAAQKSSQTDPDLGAEIGKHPPATSAPPSGTQSLLQPLADEHASYPFQATRRHNPDLELLDEIQKERPQHSKFVNLGPANFDPNYNIQTYTTFTSPDQRLHTLTGTFSTEFTVVRNARQDLWIQPNLTMIFEDSLPTSLKDILKLPRRGTRKNHSKRRNPDLSRFEDEVDIVSRWEISTPLLLKGKITRLRLVNHDFKGAHAEANASLPPLKFDPENAFDPDKPPDTEVRESTPEQVIPRRKRGRPRAESLVGETSRPIKLAKASKLATQPGSQAKRVRKPPTQKVRRLTTLAEMTAARDKRLQVGNQLEMNDDGTSPFVRHRRGRGISAQYYMPQSMELKLLTAVTVIRSLTGGIHRCIDWVLVAELFRPEYDQKFVQGAWPRIRAKYRGRVDEFEDDFKDGYIKAYKDNVVPPIDYDNLPDYDWAWVVNWAQESFLTMSGSNRPEIATDLPATREELDELYEVRERPPSAFNWREAYFNDNWTTLSRAELLNQHPLIIPLSPLTHVDDCRDSKFGIARSWVKANVVAPEENYNSEIARAKLQTISASAIDRAIESLIADNVIIRQHKGRVIPGRNYDISKNFITKLKRNLDESHFQQATVYKYTLDEAFRDKGEFLFSYHAKDGDTLVATNLLAEGRVDFTPRGVPMEPFGLLDGKYKTRDMDKSRLMFDVVITPTTSYVYGNPILPLPPAPMAPKVLKVKEDVDEGEQGKIPIWYDIFGGLVPTLWRMVLASVVGTLALRPGTSIKEMTNLMSPSLEIWEVETILKWLEGVGVVGKRIEGWIVKEWWWMVVWPEIRGSAILEVD